MADNYRPIVRETAKKTTRKRAAKKTTRKRAAKKTAAAPPPPEDPTPAQPATTEENA